MSWVFVAGTVLTVAGTGASIAANEQANSAVHKARDAESARQAELTKQRQTTFDQSLKDSSADSASQTIDQKTGQREAAYAQATAPSGVAQSAQGTPVTVQDSPGGNDVGASARAGAKLASSAWSRMVGGAQAKLGAQGDWTQQQQIKNTRASQDLALNANKSRGSLGVSQYEVEHATHAGDGLRDIGMVASALGSIGMMYGAAGLAAPAAGSTAGVTGAQSAALNAGFGPVSASYAQTVAPVAASAWQNAGVSPWATALGGVGTKSLSF